jgi:class 3 adenylate cyclase
MKLQIRYVQVADGTRIATASMGEGRPLVLPAAPLTSMELRWEIPEVRANLERFAEERMVVLYDARGTGLSTREVTDLSLDARVADLDAVAMALGPAEVDLFAMGVNVCPVAIAYAARHPNRVRKLALASPVARVGETGPMDERLALLEPLAEVDWNLYLQCRALVSNGWTDLGRRTAELQLREISRDIHAAYMKAIREDDVTSLLPLVACPTLVLLRRGSRLRVTESPVLEVAAAIPNARLVTIEQDHVMIVAGEWDSSLRAVAEFLDEDRQPAPSQQQPVAGATAVILFADIADHTAYTVRIGDAAFREKARPLDEALRNAVREHGGTVVDGKTLGDGILATFPAASQAIGAALALEAAAGPTGLGLHIGLHAGDVLREVDADGRSNVFGSAVSIASRISALAAPGEVLVSRTVADLARSSAGVTFEDRGEHALKGVADPQRVFAVRSAEAG